MPASVMSLFDAIRDRTRQSLQTIALPESDDARVLEAAALIARDNLAIPVLIGDTARIERLAGQHALDLSGVRFADPQAAAGADYGELLYALRAARGLTRERAIEQARQPLVYGALMLHEGDVDGYVAGAAHTTSEVLRVALQVIGMADYAKLVSSFFIMEHDLPHQAIQGTAVYADCAMVINPDAEQLADIAINTANSARQLLNLEPRVALLSFSTAGSADHPHVAKVRRAGAIVAERRPDLVLLPEVQFDAAVVPEILARKAPAMAATAANVFIFPELQSANIGYKIAERIGGVRAIGPILQGLNKPVNDLSRGCRVADIVQLATVTALQAQARKTGTHETRI